MVSSFGGNESRCNKCLILCCDWHRPSHGTWRLLINLRSVFPRLEARISPTSWPAPKAPDSESSRIARSAIRNARSALRRAKRGRRAGRRRRRRTASPLCRPAGGPATKAGGDKAGSEHARSNLASCFSGFVGEAARQVCVAAEALKCGKVAPALVWATIAKAAGFAASRFARSCVPGSTRFPNE